MTPTKRFGVHFDWTLNLTHVATFISCVITGLWAYADLKSDVRNQKTVTEAKFAEYDRQLVLQRGIDDGQDQRLQRAVVQIDSSLREMRQDLRTDIKDLRSDLTVRRASPAASSTVYPGPIKLPRETGG